MSYIGYVPAAKPLTSADITDGVITSAKIADGTIVNADINASAAIASTKLSGSFGKVLQVLGATDTTERSTTSSSFVTASNTLSVTITPTSSSSKFAIFVNHYAGSSSGYGQYTIARGGTNLGGSEGMAQYNSGSGSLDGSVSYCYLDSPATSSSITYQPYMKAGVGTQKMGQANRTAQIIVIEIAG